MALTHVGTNDIKTDRLLLRKFRYEDNESMRRHWAGDIFVQKMYSEPIYTTEAEAHELLTKYIEAYAPNYYRWAITLADNKECIGQIAYFMINDNNHWGELEYCIGREFQKQGYITEAVRAVLAYGFEQINLHKVQVCHKLNNPASRRVIEKCGFTYEGMLRDYFFMDGEYVHRLYYSMLKNEFENIKA